MPGSELRANIHRLMDDIWHTLSFGVGRKNSERNYDSPFVTDTHPGWDTEAAKPLRHKANAQLGTIGQRQPLRRSLRRRAGPRLGRRPLRLAWTRSRHCDVVPQGRRSEGRHDGRSRLLRRNLRPWCAVHRRHAARRNLCLRRPRLGLRPCRPSARRDHRGGGAQPPQLRVAGRARRQAALGLPQGSHAGLSRPARLRRRNHGRAVGHPRRHRSRRHDRRRASSRRAAEGIAVLHRPRCRPRDGPQAGDGCLRPQDRRRASAKAWSSRR